MHKVKGAEAGQQARPTRGGGAKFHITFWAMGVTAAFGDIKVESSTIPTVQQGAAVVVESLPILLLSQLLSLLRAMLTRICFYLLGRVYSSLFNKEFQFPQIREAMCSPS